MVSFYGDYNLTETVNIPFNTFSSDDPSASVTVTDLANGDVYVHKDGVEGTPTGITVSLNVGAVNGNHLAILDLSDTNDAGFYAVGSRYQVRMEGVTIDGATVNAWIGAFSIGCTLRPTTTGRTLDVAATGEAGLDFGNTTGTIDAAQLGGDCITAAKIADDAISSEHINTGALTADAFAADALVAATFATGAFTADAFAANALVAATFAADCITEAKIADNAIATEHLAASALQDVAQVAAGTSGVVYHVKASGGSDGNGLSWDDAYLHTTTSAKTVIEAASANDVVLLGPGTFALGDNAIEVPAGVTVKAAGIDITTITSTKNFLSGGSVIYVPGDNTLTEDLTVAGIGENQAAVGTFKDADRDNQAFTNAVLRRVKGSADMDGFYVNHNANQISATLIDCSWYSEFDGMSFRKAEAGSNFVLINNRIYCDCSTDDPARGIWCEEADISVWAHNIDIYVTAPSTQASYGIWCDDGLVVLHGGRIYNTAITYPIPLYQYDSGTLIVIGVDYDRSETSGTITEISSAESALVAKNLDHLMKTAVANNADMTVEVPDGTVLSNIMTSDSDTSGYAVATDSLEAIRDKETDIETDTAEIGTAGAGLSDLGGMSTEMKAEVNVQAKDVINTDTYAEPGQGAPAATTSLKDKIGYLYKNWRNKKTQDATTWELYADDTTTVDQKSTLSDDGTATKGEIATGP